MADEGAAAQLPQIIITDSADALAGAERHFPALERLLVNGDASIVPAGRRLVLMPSAGRVAQARLLADKLVSQAAEVKLCVPEADRPFGWSIADLADGTGGAWAKAVRETIQIPAQAAEAVTPGFSAANLPPPLAVEPVNPALEPRSDALEPPAYLDEPPSLGSMEAPKTRRRRQKPDLTVITSSAARAPDPEEDDEILPLALSESGVAAEFAAEHQDRFRVVHEWGSKGAPAWMAWSGTRWRRENNRVSAWQAANALAITLKYRPEAAGVTQPGKHKMETKKFIGAFLDLASFDEKLRATPEIFDADAFMLGTPAGTVDLERGKMMEAEREHYITRQTAVSPEAGPHPLFDDLIRRASGGEADIAAYLWNWLGYILTGSVKEKAFLYLHGKTDSGKTTLASAIAGILGNSDEGGYAAQCDIELFTETKLDKGNDRLAHLAGARFAYASEMEEGRNFKAALLKIATGADMLHGRFLYAEQFSFQPSHKLWIFGNHQMHMRASDAALTNRLHLLEYKDAFIVTPEERDNDFGAKLKAEYPAILASMIQAAVNYLQVGGLGRPDSIAQAVDTYATSEDTLGEWIADCLNIEVMARTLAGDAYQSFTRWADKQGAYAPSAKRFGQQLIERGFTRIRVSSGRMFVGFTIKAGADL